MDVQTEPQRDSSVTYIPRSVILIPGLFEPSIALLPLQISMQTHAETIERWHDRIAFRSFEKSVSRLADAIAGDPDELGSIGLVTHSFGDWVARAAIAKSSHHRVRSMVSLAPVMRSGFLSWLAYALTWKLIPEIKVIMDRELACANLNCDQRVRRLVIWSHFDESLRQMPLDQVPNVRVEKVWATHLSIAWQPRVLRLAKNFLFFPTEN
ncbi:hypothetical protein Pla22_23620 [Rubripirellula amarantea]|uniref:Alpha/beta hydrolase family protein n=1 Tax=Rubripirellula amarantea TaxID=2527999 RepID=A0A5C5WX80_9BACT|nr:hypothetical protein [Rubripirellula amarantea]TWT54711.1 hypothetical protein Pla22_23620 [Rubripirellula amarantea]